MADPNHERPIHLDADEARGATTPGVTRYVLGASLVLVIVAFLAVYFFH